MSLLDGSPVFVVGAQRSGTTWVQRLLAAHPAIVSGQESHLFSGYLAPLWQRWQMERDQRASGRTVGLGCYVTEEEFVEELRRLTRRVFARLERAKPGARLLVEKTPDHGLHLPLIRRLFPDAIIIHVLRDGRDVAASLRDASRQPWGRTWASGSAEAAGRRWVEWVGAIRRGLDGFSRTRTVRYEDLAADGPAVLGELYRFLGAPLPPHLIKSIYQLWQFGASTAGGPDSLVLEGDCRGKAPGEPEGFFRRGRPGGWKTDLSSEEQAAVQAVAGELLAELGYPCEPAGAAPAGEVSNRFISLAAPDDLLWARPNRLGVLDSTNAQMLPRERLYLYATILALAPERCLEVGVSQGGSTRIIHAALTDLGRGRLVALDPEPALAYPAETLADVVTFLTGPSPAALEQARDLAGGLFDFVLLDGDHSEEGVRRDLDGLAAVTRPGALILAHDAYCPSVAAGIKAALKGGTGYVDVGVVSTTRHPGRVGNNEVVFAGFRLLVRTEQGGAGLCRAA